MSELDDYINIYRKAYIEREKNSLENIVDNYYGKKTQKKLDYINNNYENLLDRLDKVLDKYFGGTVKANREPEVITLKLLMDEETKKIIEGYDDNKKHKLLREHSNYRKYGYANFPNIKKSRTIHKEIPSFDKVNFISQSYEINYSRYCDNLETAEELKNLKKSVLFTGIDWKEVEENHLLLYLSFRVGNLDEYILNVENKEITDLTSENALKIMMDVNEILMKYNEMRTKTYNELGVTNLPDNIQKRMEYLFEPEIYDFADVILKYNMSSEFIEASEIKKRVALSSLEAISQFRKFDVEEYKKTIDLVKDTISSDKELKSEENNSKNVSFLVNSLYGLYGYSEYYYNFETFKRLIEYSKNSVINIGETINMLLDSINIKRYYLNHKKAQLKHQTGQEDDFLKIYGFVPDAAKHLVIEKIWKYLDKDYDVIENDSILSPMQTYYQQHIAYHKEIEESEQKPKSRKFKVSQMYYRRYFDRFTKIFRNMSEEYQEKVLGVLLMEKNKDEENSELDKWVSDNYSGMVAKVARMNAGGAEDEQHI